jgi:hypothetical protein
VLGSSTHYGTVAIDAAAHVLVFRIEGASFPNWEGTEQRRKYALAADSLSYQVPTPRPDGTVPISEWKRSELDPPPLGGAVAERLRGLRRIGPGRTPSGPLGHLPQRGGSRPR